MSNYAILKRNGRIELLAIWTDVDIRRAEVLADLDGAQADALTRVATALEGLSETLWHRYGQGELDMEEARREVSERLAKPELPEGGYEMAYYDAIEEFSARLARALHQLGLPEVTTAVHAEVERELDAVARAGLGDLKGRASQATNADRRDASPTQVAAAHDLLASHASGDGDLQGLVRLEPAAAATATGAWCVAAARVFHELSGQDPAAAAYVADDVEAIDIKSTDAVLRGVLEEGRSVTEVVGELLADSDAKDVFNSLIDAYHVLWELLDEYVDVDGGAPLIKGVRLPHPDGLVWPFQLPEDEDEQHSDAWRRAVRFEMGTRIAAQVKPSP